VSFEALDMLVPGDGTAGSGKIPVIGRDGDAVESRRDTSRITDISRIHHRPGFCIQADSQSALRRCQPDNTVPPVDGDSADIIGKTGGDLLRQGDETEFPAPAQMADERRQRVAGAFPLASEPDLPAIAYRNVTGR